VEDVQPDERLVLKPHATFTQGHVVLDAVIFQLVQQKGHLNLAIPGLEVQRAMGILLHFSFGAHRTIASSRTTASSGGAAASSGGAAARPSRCHGARHNYWGLLSPRFIQRGSSTMVKAGALFCFGHCLCGKVSLFRCNGGVVRARKTQD
jgi:hypothetical protein